MIDATPLEGRRALVTGAAQGLGAGIAQALAAAGASVVCADLADASGTADSIGAAATAVHLDVSSARGVTETVATLSADGDFDILVCNAGVNHPIGPVLDLPLEHFERNWNVNTMGVVHCVRAVAPAMSRAGWGRVVVVASMLGKAGVAGLGPYCASKFAVVGLVECLALELASTGVTVNAICPGTMDTPMIRGNLARALGPDAAPDAVQDRLDAIATGKPTGRLGTPADIGALAVYLSSPAASFTTGASINLTGGEAVHF